MSLFREQAIEKTIRDAGRFVKKYSQYFPTNPTDELTHHANMFLERFHDEKVHMNLLLGYAIYATGSKISGERLTKKEFEPLLAHWLTNECSWLERAEKPGRVDYCAAMLRYYLEEIPKMLPLPTGSSS